VFQHAGPSGAAVCRIEGVGCDFPEEQCFCECLGSECAYWSYWHLENGEWVYAGRGASLHMVRDGDIEAWVWGGGTYGKTAGKPVLPLPASLCATPTPIVHKSQSVDLTTRTPTGTPGGQDNPVSTSAETPSAPAASGTPTGRASSSPVPTITTRPIELDLEAASETEVSKTRPTDPSRVTSRWGYAVFGVAVVGLSAGLLATRSRKGPLGEDREH
jgi:hypothetical protein